MEADPHTIQAAVSKLAGLRLARRFRSVSVEPAESIEGGEYLLVTVQLSGGDVEDDALEGLLEEIESEVARVDDRYPSVRFMDAA